MNEDKINNLEALELLLMEYKLNINVLDLYE